MVILFVSCYLGYCHVDYRMETIFDSIWNSMNYTFSRFEPAVIRNPREDPFEWTRILRENRNVILDELQEFLVAHSSTMEDLQIDSLMP